MEENEVIKIVPNPAQVSYELSVSSSRHLQLKDEQGRPIQRSETEQFAFHISLVVKRTNRAAMSEYLCVMRPKPTGTTAYEYLERTAVVRNQLGGEDINLPELYFDGSRKLMLRLKSMDVLQVVIVTVTRYV